LTGIGNAKELTGIGNTKELTGIGNSKELTGDIGEDNTTAATRVATLCKGRSYTCSLQA
jgi:hypothetical protein